MKHRNTLFQESSEIVSHQAFEGDQFIVRLNAPKTAEKARPGHFVHLTVDQSIDMRRPISIMRASATEGWIDLLYKVVGHGTDILSTQKPGACLSIIGPIGNPFEIKAKRPLLIGGGVGMPPMIFIAESLKDDPEFRPFVILGSEVPFPFKAIPSKIMVGGIPSDVIAAMPLLDDWHIPSRLCSLQDYAGTYRGYVSELADQWLGSLDDQQKSEVCIYSCGPEPMLKSVVDLARRHDVPVQVSLEEYMACAVGGCAGCVVEVKLPEGNAMKRVCVDGPVFDGYQIY